MDTNIGIWERVLEAPTKAYQELFEVERDYLVEKISPNSQVLDVGCGEGRNIKNILAKTKNVFGVDNDQVAVKDAAKNFENIPTVKVIQAEASKLPFKNDFFDAVTFLMILPNLANEKQSALAEAVRVLKPNGILILSTFAETAFNERMKIYKQIKAPIKKIERTTVIFDNVVSEQFSLDQLKALADEAGLIITENRKIGELAYILTLKKSEHHH